MIRINKEKSIGHVLFVTEGVHPEFDILKTIFCSLLEYDYCQISRDGNEEYKSINNKDSLVAVINAGNSNISSLENSEDYFDGMYEYLRNSISFSIDNCAVYFLFDRDPGSNRRKVTAKAIDTYQDPYDNNFDRAGMILLSYPSIEAFLISNFCDNTFEERSSKGKNLKQIVQDKGIIANKISEDTLAHATNEFLMFLEKEELEFDIDSFGWASKSIFERQEEDRNRGKEYRLFSMVVLALIQLGIIVIE